MSRTIDYGNLMHEAMRGLIRRVLRGVEADGLPGNHHFFVTFDTTHPDSEMADWLSDRYPEEMTIVIQSWYRDLHVDEDGFAITLNFGENPEPLYIPFDAVRTFVDPSVEFGLRFETQDDDDDTDEDQPVAAAEPDAPEEPVPVPDDKGPREAEIVSLDKFRKP